MLFVLPTAINLSLEERRNMTTCFPWRADYNSVMTSSHRITVCLAAQGKLNYGKLTETTNNKFLLRFLDCRERGIIKSFFKSFSTQTDTVSSHIRLLGKASKNHLFTLSTATRMLHMESSLQYLDQTLDQAFPAMSCYQQSSSMDAYQFSVRNLLTNLLL